MNEYIFCKLENDRFCMCQDNEFIIVANNALMRNGNNDGYTVREFQARIPYSDMRNMEYKPYSNNIAIKYVTNDGSLKTYSIDAVDGNECVKIVNTIFRKTNFTVKKEKKFIKILPDIIMANFQFILGVALALWITLDAESMIEYSDRGGRKKGFALLTSYICKGLGYYGCVIVGSIISIICIIFIFYRGRKLWLKAEYYRYTLR